jgi:N-methylhydantoinase B
MGVALMRAAFSPNIKERRDHSCAIFDAEGQLLAQAEHIPVHLGAMRASVEAALKARGPRLREGDTVLVNDPFFGGSHLPDLTLVSPVYLRGTLLGYVANRAHHADIGGMTPGSMPPHSRDLFAEGLVLPPVRLRRAGRIDHDLLSILLANTRSPAERRGDLEAQLAANELGCRRVGEIARREGLAAWASITRDLLEAGERSARSAFEEVVGEGVATDWLEGEDESETDLPIVARVRIADGRFFVDFAGTAPQVRSNLNAPPPVTEAAVLYVARAFLAPKVLANGGFLRRVGWSLPEGSILAPKRPAAVVAGNVETSQRVVDCLLMALRTFLPDRIPAASQGTMNNVLLGADSWSYYETIGGGQGARRGAAGMNGIHTHMTNTLNTPVEALEHAYPLRVRSYTLRAGSGGAGRWNGGEGIVREIEVLAPIAVASVLADRRKRGPWGSGGGASGAAGGQVVIRADGREERISAKSEVTLRTGDRLRILTPGGGGWGYAE